jgi:hypothetical protein
MNELTREQEIYRRINVYEDALNYHRIEKKLQISLVRCDEMQLSSAKYNSEDESNDQCIENLPNDSPILLLENYSDSDYWEPTSSEPALRMESDGLSGVESTIVSDLDNEPYENIVSFFISINSIINDT